MRQLLPIAALAMAVSACASTDATAPASTTVDVTATYRERIMLTPGHVLTVKIEDVSRADAPAIVLAQTTQNLDGKAPPYSVSLKVPSNQIDPRMTYAARAEIRDASGNLRFTTDTRHSVLTHGAPNRADIMMIGIRQP